MIFALGSVLLLLLGVALVLRALEPSLLFHQRTAAQEWRVFGNDFEELQMSDGTSALWCPLSGAQTTVLYCHGNFGNISMREDWVRALQRHLRASVLLFDYPGFGKTPGKPTEAGCYSSAQSAFSWLLERGIQAEQILLWGKSLGAAMAIELAVQHPTCRAMVIIDPFTCVPDAANVLLRVPLGFLARNRFNNARKIGEIPMPKIILGAELDALCPSWMAARLGELAREPKAVQIVTGRRHAEFLAESEWKWMAQKLGDLNTEGTEEQR